MAKMRNRQKPLPWSGDASRESSHGEENTASLQTKTTMLLDSLQQSIDEDEMIGSRLAMRIAGGFCVEMKNSFNFVYHLFSRLQVVVGGNVANAVDYTRRSVAGESGWSDFVGGSKTAHSADPVVSNDGCRSALGGSACG